MTYQFSENLQNLKYLVRMNKSEIKNYKNETLFLEELIEAVSDELNQIKPIPKTVLNKWILQSISLLAEAYDQIGKYEEAVEVIKKWAEYYQDDFSSPKLISPNVSGEKNDSEVEFAVTKQKVWICLIYALLLYRDENYEVALKYLRKCENVVEKIRTKESHKLKSLGRRLYGTRSRIAFQMAQILYEIGDHDSAEKYSEKSLNLILNRLESKTIEISSKYSKKEDSHYKIKIEKEEVYARQLYAKILSFCQAKHLRANGKLKDCLQLQQLGRICLHDLNQSYLQRLLFDVEICITERLMSENEVRVKNKILTKINQLLKDFKDADFQYHRKLLIEKVTILLQLLQSLDSNKKDFSESRDQILEKVKDSLQQLNKKAQGKKWQWRIFLLEARLAEVEERYEEAHEFVNKGLEEIEFSIHKSGLRQAMLQKGRLYSAEKHYDSAIKIFQKTILLCRKNDLTFSLCQISLADCYLQRGEKNRHSKDIQTSFEFWSAFQKTGSENGNVMALATRLQHKFNDLENSFFLPKWDNENSIDLNVKKNTMRLRKWLLGQAQAKLEQENKALTDKNLSSELGFSSPASMTNYLKIED